jgi:hypothetical protein
MLSKPNSVGMVAGEGMELLEIRGNATAFIRLPEGRTSFHLLNLMPDTGLFLEIEKLIQQSQNSEETATQKRVPFESGGGIRDVNIEVSPLKDRRGHVFLIQLDDEIHENVAPVPDNPPVPESPASPSDRLIRKLK